MSYSKSIIAALLLCFAVTPANAQKNLEWHSFEEALILAHEKSSLIFVDIWAPWCGWCHKMKKDVYPKLKSVLTKGFILTRLNRSDNETRCHYRGKTLTPLRLAQQLHADVVPAIVILNPKGEYLFHLTGYIKANRLRPILKKIAAQK